MSKPDWKDAPVWARYLMRAVNGAWWWLECEPLWRDRQWFRIEGMQERAEEGDYKPVLEERP